MERILRALGDSRTVVNVGAGTGSYEPRDRHVIAIEPSDVMADQRPAELAPAIRGEAFPLPLRDRSVDAALAVMTVHHWDEQRERGVRELRRVARGPVVIATYDIAVCAQMWLFRDYMPDAAMHDAARFRSPEELADWLGGEVEVEAVPISRESPDWTLASFWAHPERVLDERARNGTSEFARMDPGDAARIADAVARDLGSGAWDERHGHLREVAELDVGMRLLISRPAT